MEAALNEREVVRFLLEKGGRCTNFELVSNFKGVLNHPRTQAAARLRFKDIINTVGIVGEFQNIKYIELKNEYFLNNDTHTNDSGLSSSEYRNQYSSPFTENFQPYWRYRQADPKIFHRSRSESNHCDPNRSICGNPLNPKVNPDSSLDHGSRVEWFRSESSSLPNHCDLNRSISVQPSNLKINPDSSLVHGSRVQCVDETGRDIPSSVRYETSLQDNNSFRQQTQGQGRTYFEHSQPGLPHETSFHEKNRPEPPYLSSRNISHDQTLPPYLSPSSRTLSDASATNFDKRGSQQNSRYLNSPTPESSMINRQTVVDQIDPHASQSLRAAAKALFKDSRISLSPSHNSLINLEKESRRNSLSSASSSGSNRIARRNINGKVCNDQMLSGPSPNHKLRRGLCNSTGEIVHSPNAGNHHQNSEAFANHGQRKTQHPNPIDVTLRDIRSRITSSLDTPFNRSRSSNKDTMLPANQNNQTQFPDYLIEYPYDQIGIPVLHSTDLRDISVAHSIDQIGVLHSYEQLPVTRSLEQNLNLGNVNSENGATRHRTTNQDCSSAHSCNEIGLSDQSLLPSAHLDCSSVHSCNEIGLPDQSLLPSAHLDCSSVHSCNEVGLPNKNFLQSTNQTANPNENASQQNTNSNNLTKHSTQSNYVSRGSTTKQLNNNNQSYSVQDCEIAKSKSTKASKLEHQSRRHSTASVRDLKSSSHCDLTSSSHCDLTSSSYCDLTSSIHCDRISLGHSDRSSSDHCDRSPSGDYDLSLTSHYDLTSSCSTLSVNSEKSMRVRDTDPPPPVPERRRHFQDKPEVGNRTPDLEKDGVKQDALSGGRVRDRVQQFDDIERQQKRTSSKRCSFNKENYIRGTGTDDDISISVIESKLKREWFVKCAQCDYQALAALLKKEPKLAAIKDPAMGYTALHWAAKKGDANVVKLIAGAYKVNPNIRSNGGYTPVHIASLHKHGMIIHLLVHTYGADDSLRDYSGKRADQYPDDFGRTTTAQRPITPERMPLKQRPLEKDSGSFMRIGSLNIRKARKSAVFASVRHSRRRAETRSVSMRKKLHNSLVIPETTDEKEKKNDSDSDTTFGFRSRKFDS